MSTNPDEDKTTPMQPVPDPNAAWWSSDPWYDEPPVAADPDGPTVVDAGPGGTLGTTPGGSGGTGSTVGLDGSGATVRDFGDFGAPGATVRDFNGPGGTEPTLPFRPPDPIVLAGPGGGWGANQGANQGADSGAGGFPPSDTPPFYLGQQPPSRPPARNRRNLAAVLGVIGVVTTLVVVLVATGGSPSNTSAGPAPSPTVTETDSTQPTDTSTDDVLPTDTTTTDDLPTIATFDPGTMDNASTDTAPFTTDALMPENFTDSKNVEYQLEAGGVENCIEKSMSSNVQSALRQSNCSQELTASYTVDSTPAANSSDDILVSVQIFAFNDASTAQAVYADFPSTSSWDFGIWCPKTGDGANPCSADADYTDAYKSEWIGQDHRYVIEATALYTDMSSDSSVSDWTSAAAKEAVNSSGPVYYISNQD